ncbi:MAG: hypothetical protein EOO60_07090 [Hymenobacter sp.]|nr:MAG: hypothetical protein EOO60_07090 [Hymenobacter sp.]
MLDERYSVRAAHDLTSFNFDSVGPKGIVRKVVRYTEINLKDVYNLGFGDQDPLTGYLSDLAVTNNNDSKKVLATVAATLYAFTVNNPAATIIASGSTDERTRLYQIGIASKLHEIEQDFVVLVLNAQQEWEPFRKNVTYGAFLVYRKS